MKQPVTFGVSFSLKCQDELLGKGKECLKAALSDMGVKRLRLMSYWDEHENIQGTYDFTELDWQIDLAEAYGAQVTLCVGLRQPRWPESHWPQWAKDLPEHQAKIALLYFIKAVVNRYKNRRCIVSWQLENEALLKSFGTNGDFNRERLKEEFALVKALDTRPVIMTTSDAFGLPIHKPVPDMYAYSIYRYTFKHDKYIYQVRPALAYYMRSLVIRLVHRRRSFIHELQCEPWGPKGNGQMTLEECFKSMSFERFKDAVAHAQKTRLSPIDLWGLEWWWWLKTSHNDDRFWNYARDHIFNTPS